MLVVADVVHEQSCDDAGMLKCVASLVRYVPIFR